MARVVFSTLFLSVVSISFSAYCFAQQVAPQIIKVGVIQSLTGFAAEDGKTVIQSLQLAAEDINARGSYHVQLLLEDDGTQTKNTVSAFEKLAEQDVAAIIGATWDFTSNAIMSRAGRKKIVLFNTSTLLEALNNSDAQGYAFVNASTAESEAGPFEKYLEAAQPKNAVVVFANNSWGETQLKVYKRIAASHGVKIIEELRSTLFDANEWNVFITKIKQKNANLVVLLLNKNDLTLFIRRGIEQELKSKIFASKNLYDAWEGEASKDIFNGVCFTYPLAQLSNEQPFVIRYRERYQENPRIYADNTYDSLFIIKIAYELAHKRQISLRDALRQVSYKGLVGTYNYSEKDSFSLGQASLVCIEEARLVVKN